MVNNNDNENTTTSSCPATISNVGDDNNGKSQIEFGEIDHDEVEESSITLADIHLSHGEGVSDSGMISSLTLNDISASNFRDGDHNSRSNLQHNNIYSRFLRHTEKSPGGGDVQVRKCSSIASDDSFDRNASCGADSLMEDFMNEKESVSTNMNSRASGTVENVANTSNRGNNVSFDPNKAEVFSWASMKDDVEELEGGRGRQDTASIEANPVEEQSMDLKVRGVIDKSVTFSNNSSFNRDSLAPISENYRSSSKSSTTAATSNDYEDAPPGNSHLPVAEGAAESQNAHGETVTRRKSRGLSLLVGDRKALLSLEDDASFDGDHGACFSWDASAQTLDILNKESLAVNQIADDTQKTNMQNLVDGQNNTATSDDYEDSPLDNAHLSFAEGAAQSQTAQEESFGRRKSRGLSLIEKRHKVKSLINDASFDGDLGACFSWNLERDDDDANYD